MKRKITNFYLFAAALITLLSFTACQDLFNPPDVSGTGRLELSINGTGGRTILPPANTAFDRYTLDFYVGNASAPAHNFQITSPAEVIELNPGTYRLVVTGFKGNTRSASGTITGLVITAGSTTTRNVILVPYTEGTVKGTFSWNLTAFTGTVTIEIEKYNVSGNVVTLNNAGLTGTYDLDAGIYTVIFTVGDITWFNILYIYPGLTSNGVFDPNNLTFDDPNNSAGFTITGTFAAQNAPSGNATFFASQIAPAPAPSMRSMARSMIALTMEEEIDLEGLLEDGDITFRLRGTYNSITGHYVLSAASSFLRYSISGNTEDTKESKAVIQFRAGGGWESIEIPVTASSAGNAPNIEADEIEDDFSNSIPREMWGVWWGMDSIIKEGNNVIQSGDYYYVIDAFTIVEYIKRHNTWNREGFTFFYDGASVNSNGQVSGSVLFNYTDQALIDHDNPTWWINHLADYANIMPSSPLTKAQVNAPDGNWGDPEWTAKLSVIAAAAQESGFTNERWDALFNKKPYSFEAYRKDVYQFYNDYLQMGMYYKAPPYAPDGHIYFDESPAVAAAFTDQRWNRNNFTRDLAAAQANPPTSQLITTGEWGVFSIPAQSFAVNHNSFEGKNNVLQVTSGVNWSVLEYDLNQFSGHTGLSITASMDIWLPRETFVIWQINQDGYPIILGDADNVYEAGKWITLTQTAEASGLSILPWNRIFLSRMQFGESEIYIANVSINVNPGNPPVAPTVMAGNLGPYEFDTDYDSGNILPSRARWGLHGENLGKAQAVDATLVFEFTEPPANLDFVWGAAPAWWNATTIIENGVTANGVTLAGNTLTINLRTIVNSSTNASVFLSADYANILLVAWEGLINQYGMTSANVTGTYVPPTDSFTIDLADLDGGGWDYDATLGGLINRDTESWNSFAVNEAGVGLTLPAFPSGFDLSDYQYFTIDVKFLDSSRNEVTKTWGLASVKISSDMSANYGWDAVIISINNLGMDDGNPTQHDNASIGRETAALNNIIPTGLIFQRGNSTPGAEGGINYVLVTQIRFFN